jgi:glycosyltransferase involved in cell wall biosynthesis
VIVIFLDEARFIREAIDSVFAQTYQHWELLLVDDGSRDQSSGIARSIADQHPDKIRYFEHAGHQNLGMSASRNLGIRHAKGNYIAFLDADDVWSPVKLEQQLAIFRAYPDAQMVLGAVQWWFSWTGNPQDLKLDFVEGLNVQPNRLIEPPELLTALLQKDTVTSTVSLTRREAIVHVGGFEETFRGLYEDQVFFAKLSCSAAIYVTNTCWYKWRKHADSACSVAVSSGQYQAERLKYLTWLDNYLSQHGILRDELSRTLKNQIWKSRHPSLSRLRNSVQNPRWMTGALGGLAHHVLPSVCRQWLSARLHRKK